MEFPKRFLLGKCKQIYLTKNYRSEPPIIEFYNRWMEATDWQEGDQRFRFDKEIFPSTPRTTPYPSVFKVSGEDAQNNWATETTMFLNDLRSKDVIKDWNQIAFLFRSVRNTNVVAFANALETAGIPIYAPRSNMYFEREEIRLLVGAFLFLFPQYGAIRLWCMDLRISISGSASVFESLSCLSSSTHRVATISPEPSTGS